MIGVDSHSFPADCRYVGQQQRHRVRGLCNHRRQSDEHEEDGERPTVRPQERERLTPNEPADRYTNALDMAQAPPIAGAPLERRVRVLRA